MTKNDCSSKGCAPCKGEGTSNLIIPKLNKNKTIEKKSMNKIQINNQTIYDNEVIKEEQEKY